MKKLKQQNTKLIQSKWSLEKRLQRIKTKKGSAPKTPMEIRNTPRSRASADMRKEGISPRAAPQLKRQLVFHHRVMQNLAGSVKSQEVKRSKINPMRLISGGVDRKSRINSRLHRAGIPRRQIEGKSFIIKKQRLVLERDQIKEKIVTFLGEQDNSQMMPGKADCMKVGGKVVQKRILNDYLYNLHAKYLAENPNETVSLTVFNRARPVNFLLANFATRKTCLCPQHQNLALKLKALHNIGMKNSKNPDSFIKAYSDEEIKKMLEDLEVQKIKYREWARVEVTKSDGTSTKATRVIPREMKKDEFIAMFMEKIEKMRGHVIRVKAQFDAVRELKKKLPFGHTALWLDFAESHECSECEEISSGYWGEKCKVTLLPAVMYYRTEPDGELKHKAFNIISPDHKNHNAATVYAFLKKLIPKMKAVNPVTALHYISDSPTSQFRNKTIFYILANHGDLLGVELVSWIWLEAGHGKGPGDGIGGTSKRMADQAVRSGKVEIRDAEDFYNWASNEDSKITYLYVSKEECDLAAEELRPLPLKTVSGTMKIHAAVSVKPGTIAVRDTSCYCDKCFTNGVFSLECEGWKQHTLVAEPSKPSVSASAPVNEEVPEVHNSYEKGDFVAATYDDEWYIGEITAVDHEEDEFQVKFMEKSTGRGVPSFKWKEGSTCWVPLENVMAKVKAPTGKRLQKLSKEDYENIMKLWAN